MFDSILNMRLGIVLKKIIIVSFVNLQDMPWNIFSWCWSFKLKKSRLGKLLQVVSLVMYPAHLVFLQIFCLLILVKCSFCELEKVCFQKLKLWCSHFMNFYCSTAQNHFITQDILWSIWNFNCCSQAHFVIFSNW